ncbi:hypothetical protein C5E45_04695 [Nocardia nova]|uniref:Uncharacterized protein n=1 Tax=Nocardia nova TaxID=37330 RepID=A0A2S6AVY8_9NOCA|nr:hypothetical protein C5E41_03620 [Nocardia nova]PPJ39437.1 hypothetical protein C5E45_04695 [Nocardia nova]
MLETLLQPFRRFEATETIEALEPPQLVLPRNHLPREPLVVPRSLARRIRRQREPPCGHSL